MEAERDTIRESLTKEKNEILNVARAEITEMEVKCYNYKTELDSLLDFKSRKASGYSYHDPEIIHPNPEIVE